MYHFYIGMERGVWEEERGVWEEGKRGREGFEVGYIGERRTGELSKRRVAERNSGKAALMRTGVVKLELGKGRGHEVRSE